jgi:transcriptional regulator with XRE-family HTH domain
MRMDQQIIIAQFEARAKKLGITREQMCSKADIHPTSFSRWKMSDANPNPMSATLFSLNKIEDVLSNLEAEQRYVL